MTPRQLPTRAQRGADLDAKLARLPSVDLEPLPARMQLLAAQRRLSAPARRPSRFDRYEPAILLVFASAHLVWAITQLLGLLPA